MLQKKAIELNQISKSYGSTEIIRNLDLDVLDNEFFTLLGPSGCGKTTILRMIAGFEAPTSGQIKLFGVDIAELSPHKRHVNTVFQSYALFPHMTLRQNIEFGLENLKWDKKKRDDRVDEMLKMIHMDSFCDRFPAQISGGQRQRIALGRALAPRPSVLLLDEPLSALDLKLRIAMRDELRDLQKKTGVTFIFVTHDQEEALDMSDKICVLSQGVIQQIGTPREIYERPENKLVSGFIGEANLLDVEVMKVRNGLATISLPIDGLVISGPHNNAEVGKRATLMIRPEALSLNIPNHGDISFEGEVTHKNYLGGSCVYVVDVNGSRIRVSATSLSSTITGIKIGDKVRVGIKSEKIWILGK